MRLIGKRYQTMHGLTLIELLVSVAVGAILLLGVFTIYRANLDGNLSLLRSARMNQDLGAIMGIMINDIRRTGFDGGVHELYQDEYNSIGADVLNKDLRIVTDSCLLYSYDENYSALDAQSNGNAIVIDDGEKSGFKLENGKVLMRTSCTGVECLTSCTVGTWQSLSDDAVVLVTSMTFTSTGSKCQNSDAGSYWVTTSASATSFPCYAANGTGVNYYASLDATGTSSFSTPGSGNQLIEARQININLTATLSADSSFIKSMSSSVRIRNDKVMVQP